MALWATDSDVQLLTNTSALEEHIIKAQGDVSIFAKVAPTEDVYEYLTDSDKYWLKLATAAQAAKHANLNADSIKHDITNMSQDGLSFTLTETGAVLAPRAKWAISNLSWNRSRKVGVGGYNNGDFLNSVCSDAPVGWKKLEE